MWQRRLRRWIWRANGLLAVVAVAIGVHALTYEAERIDVASRIPELVLEGTWTPEPSVTEAELDAFLAVVEVFHGRDPAPREPVVKSVATEPPLRAYGVLLYVRDPDGRHGVTLTCKDPAHPRTYRLWMGEPHDGAELLGARFEPEAAVFDVARGGERFAFRVPIGHDGWSRVICPVGGGGRASEGDGAADPAPTALPPLPVRDAKFVAFRDDQGRPAGVRITGVRPGSWLDEMGVEPGDVVLQWAGNEVAEPADILRQAEADALPREIVVMRDVATDGARRVTIACS